MVEQQVRIRGLAAAVKGLKVVAAVLGNEAGVIGAAAMARELVALAALDDLMDFPVTVVGGTGFYWPAAGGAAR